MESERQKTNATPARPIRIAQPLWDAFGQVAGTRKRAEVIVEFIRWYVHEPHSKLPRRPDKPTAGSDSR
jgi:hypothetical protein